MSAIITRDDIFDYFKRLVIKATELRSSRNHDGKLTKCIHTILHNVPSDHANYEKLLNTCKNVCTKMIDHASALFCLIRMVNYTCTEDIIGIADRDHDHMDGYGCKSLLELYRSSIDELTIVWMIDLEQGLILHALSTTGIIRSDLTKKLTTDNLLFAECLVEDESTRSVIQSSSEGIVAILALICTIAFDKVLLVERGKYLMLACSRFFCDASTYSSLTAVGEPTDSSKAAFSIYFHNWVKRMILSDRHDLSSLWPSLKSCTSSSDSNTSQLFTIAMDSVNKKDGIYESAVTNWKDFLGNLPSFGGDFNHIINNIDEFGKNLWQEYVKSGIHDDRRFELRCRLRCHVYDTFHDLIVDTLRRVRTENESRNSMGISRESRLFYELNYLRPYSQF